MGIEEETDAGIDNPASNISVRFRTKRMPECVRLVRFRACYGIVCFHSGIGLIGSSEILAEPKA
jgi:hypothetical protein